MVGHRGSSAGSYLADPTSPIPSHCASIVATSTLRVNASCGVCLLMVLWCLIAPWITQTEHRALSLSNGNITTLQTPSIETSNGQPIILLQLLTEHLMMVLYCISACVDIQAQLSKVQWCAFHGSFILRWLHIACLSNISSYHFGGLQMVLFCFQSSKQNHDWTSLLTLPYLMSVQTDREAGPRISLVVC